MSDLGEAFSGWRAMRQAKRAQNKIDSTAMLAAEGISFEARNDGIHLIVYAGKQTLIDYWPSTGLWIVRGMKIQRRRRGVRALIRYCKENEQ